MLNEKGIVICFIVCSLFGVCFEEVFCFDVFVIIVVIIDDVESIYVVGM